MLYIKKRKEADHKTILDNPIEYRSFKFDYLPFHPLFTIPLCLRY